MNEQQKIANDNMIVKFIVGSKLYGTDTPESDTDYEGVFIQPMDVKLSLHKIEEVHCGTKAEGSQRQNNPDDVDFKMYAVDQFIHLLACNNPNKIELLFAEPIYTTRYWDMIREKKDLFLSQKIASSFMGYAHQQKQHLLNKRRRLDSFRSAKDYLNTLTELTPEISHNLITERKENGFRLFEKFFQYNLHCLEDVKGYVDAQINQYGHRTLSLDKFGYDTKFASHIFRLLVEAIDLMKYQTLSYPISERDFVLRVKSGYYELEEVLLLIDEYTTKFRKAESETKLRKLPDDEGINRLLALVYKVYWMDNDMI